MAETLLKATQVAQSLAISRAFAYQLMRLGRIPSIRIGRSIRVRETDLEGFIMKNVTRETEINPDHGMPGLVDNQSLHR